MTETAIASGKMDASEKETVSLSAERKDGWVTEIWRDGRCRGGDCDIACRNT